MATRKKIVITGASGNLGDKLRRHLESQGGYELILLDRDPRDEPGVIRADLAVYDDEWASRFADADTVVHFAGLGRATATWSELVQPNLDATLNVFQASAAHQVRRVIFASTTWVMAGYRKASGTITTDLPPRPVGAYGASKLVGERIGKSFAEQHGISVICLRLGSIRPGENRPRFLDSDWIEQRWFSNRDFCQLLEKAIRAVGSSFVVLNAMSANSGTRWDLSETRRLLGYESQDDLIGDSPASARHVRHLLARVPYRMRRLVPHAIRWRIWN